MHLFFANGDTRKKLLLRSIYLLYKKELYGLSLKEYGLKFFSRNIPI